MSTLGFILAFLAAVLSALPSPSVLNLLILITGLFFIYHG
jgi:hypothetical protein